jgi:tetratricopeptide (TPR) repeat protein
VRTASTTPTCCAADTTSVLGHRVMAPSAPGTFLCAFTFGHVRRLDRLTETTLARAWAAWAGPGDGQSLSTWTPRSARCTATIRLSATRQCGHKRRVGGNDGAATRNTPQSTAYLDAGRLKEATLEYLAALKLDPSNVEANTQFGLLLFRSGLPEPGLRSVEQALAAKGLILFMGLRQPKAAVPSLRTYLQVAPFGDHRDLAEQLLELATADRPGP